MSSPPRPRAYVLPAAAPNGYGVIRSLAEAGIDALGLDHASSPVGRSRHCRTRIIPDPAIDLAGFHVSLTRLASEEPTPPVLFPVQDYHVQALHLAEPGLRDRVRYPFLAPEDLRSCLDKRVMYSRARSTGIPIPETWTPQDTDELRDMVPAMQRFPYVIKPAAKFCFAGAPRNLGFHAVFGAKALRADTPETLLGQFREVCRRGFAALVQEEIPGPASRLVAADFYAAATGDLVAWHTGAKLRQWPPDFGTCTLGRSMDVPDIVPLSRQLIRALGFSGIGNIEFKMRGDTPYFLELNPRPWMWIQMATARGINLPAIAHHDLAGLPGFSGGRVQAAPRWVDLRMDLHHLRRIGFREWVRPLRGVRLDARCSPGDPMPAVDAAARAALRRIRRIPSPTPALSPSRQEGVT